MQFRVFSIPVVGDPAAEDALNTFLRAHRAVSVRRELVQSEGSAYWSFCVEYVEGPPATPRDGESKRGEGGRQRVDYQQVLSPPDFALFLQLRDLRKNLAAPDGVPVYAICTNEQLAAMARDRPDTLSKFKAIEGLGDAKAEKYGAAFLEVIAKTHPNPPSEEQPQDATSGKPD